MAQTADSASELPKNYLCVQALRAVAASLVVVHHAITLWLGSIVHRSGAHQWSNGAAGVDIFFVISGFVMAISLPGLAGKTNKPGVFLRRRFTRIVPLYWAALTVKIVETPFNRTPGLDSVMTPWRIAASYLFIPARNGTGQMFPLVVVGWTLNYEVFFYLLFAAALALKISPLDFLAPCMTALALLGMARTAAWPDFTSLASPLVIEFLYGMILAQLASRRKMPGPTLGALLMASAFLALLLGPEPPAPWGFLAWGLPAAAIVAGAVAIEGQMGARLPKWLLEAGDASYALYLSHTFLLPLVGNLMSKPYFTGAPALAIVIILTLAISFPVAVLIHRYVEKPLMSLLKKRRMEKPEIPTGKAWEENEAPDLPLAPVPVAEL